MAKAILRQQVGENEYVDHSLSKNVTTLGRSRSNDIVVVDTSISRLHVRIEARDGGFHVVDNNSSNGTFLNKKKISEGLLKHGDTLIVGRVSFFFQQEEESNDLKTQSLPLMEEEEQGARSTVAMSLEDISSLDDEPEYLPGEKMMDNSENDTIGEKSAIWTPPPPPMDDQPPKSYVAEDSDAFHMFEDSKGIHDPSRPVLETYNARKATSIPAAPLQRLLAYLIDAAVGMLLILPSMVASLMEAALPAALLGFLGVVLMFFHLLIGWLRFGQTIGKKVLGLRIVETEEPDSYGLSAKTTLMRLIGYVICGIPMMLPFAWILIDEDHNGLHDKLAGTRVIAVRQ